MVDVAVAPAPVAPPTPPAEKPDYRGEMVAIADIPVNTPLQCLEGWPATPFGYSTMPAGKLPDLIIFQSVRASGYGKGAVSVLYYEVLNGNRLTAKDVPASFMAKVLTGRQGKEMSERFAAHIAANPGAFNPPHSAFSGSDPEIFVVNRKTGAVIPAFTFLPPKAKAFNVGAHTARGGTYYWDGFQAEFTTQAVGCLAYLGDSHQATLQGLWNAVKKHDTKARFTLASVVDIAPEVLEATAEEHVQFGCMPSKNAYGLTGLVQDGRTTTRRFAGGHIHLGIGPRAESTYVGVVKAMDAILGVACVSMFAGYDDPIRRAYYGLPGEYRTPPHGLEYRTLSNAWLAHPLIYNMVFDLARKAKDTGLNGMLSYFWKGDEEETIRVIQGCDVDGARAILKRNQDGFTALLQSIPAYGYTAPTAFNMWYGGMDKFIADPKDIVSNWNLDGGWTIHCDGHGKNWLKAHSTVAVGGKV